METKESVKRCIEVLGYMKVYAVVKAIAESDSIGEMYSYCHKYTDDQFSEEIAEIGRGDIGNRNYLAMVGVDVCLLFI